MSAAKLTTGRAYRVHVVTVPSKGWGFTLACASYLGVRRGCHAFSGPAGAVLVPPARLAECEEVRP